MYTHQEAEKKYLQTKRGQLFGLVTNFVLQNSVLETETTLDIFNRKAFHAGKFKNHWLTSK